MATSNRKRPWLAALLAFVHPGLGHLYLREWLRAMLWFGMVLVAASVFVPETVLPASLSVESIMRATQALPTEATLAMLSVTIFSMIDAYWLATRNNRSAEAAGAGEDATGSAVGGVSFPGRGGGGGSTPTVQECPSCGKELDADLDFCHWCTHRLDASEE